MSAATREGVERAEAAIAAAIPAHEVAVEGRPVSGRFFYTRVWLGDGDRWRVRVAHLGLVEADPR